MKRRLINLRLPPELVARVDTEAGSLGQTRTKFVERALESALGKPESDRGLGAGSSTAGPASASSRAPVEKEPTSGASAGTSTEAQNSVRSAPSRPAKPSVRDTWAR